ncbi:MAG: hypothetical protein JST12_21345 [Armatimonadetes bacterium]|nr:hypothetical protein [Armatimonadota bacterium]MBS1727015.1 hypothetical protein [Armatimonadota bacterium]
MDLRLKHVIEEYWAGIQEVLRLMDASGMPRPATLAEWLVTRNEWQMGTFVGDIRFFCHGYGIAVNLPSGVLDFDFGLNGEVDGVNVHWAIQFVQKRLGEFGYSSESELKQAFEDAIAAGDLAKDDLGAYRLRG